MTTISLSSLDALRLKACIEPSRACIPPSKGKKTKGDLELPDHISPEPKTASERRDWDRMSSRMEGFHSYFRSAFQQVWVMADKAGDQLPFREYISFAEELVHHLEFHHSIEERHIFPVLAQRMPEFNHKSSAVHLEEHKAIHEGMDRYSAYLSKCKSSPSSFDAEEFRKILQSWGPILFYHLDAEVKTLHHDNLRRYYTIEEVRRLPM
ncbi:hypothetical protein BCR35DRAFT_289530 [Leucosporidium creatinivorum]|uniref:Hemerythrin-like domain-containing protein n=1 Tax=Leucosporidium creatinivorum TaxID=106004 RepID=A0A1Y2FU04_9BASI|nr:hypothetical protein BCR35DRAFT_289530 [Leucosporidium creatinivorum]